MIVQSNIKEIHEWRECVYGWPAWALESTVEIQAEVSDTIFDHPPTVAASLSSEIIDNVLDFARNPYPFDLSHSSTRKLQKKKLGQLSLVCKHWARRCRTEMFTNLRISNLEDLHTLRNWATRLEDLVRVLEFCLEGITKPWLHLLGMPLQSPLSRWHRRPNHSISTTLYVDIEKVLSQHSQHPPRFCSLLYSIPRFIPGSLSHVRNLNLSNHHFSSFFDLVHLVRELSHLMRLEIKNLSWDAPGDLPASLSARCIRSSLTYIEAEECTDAHHLIWFYAMFGLQSLLISDGDASRMGVQARVELLQIAELTRKFLNFGTGSRGSGEVVVNSGSSLDTPKRCSFAYDPHFDAPMSVGNRTQQYTYPSWESRIMVHGWLSDDFLVIHYKAAAPLANDIWPGNSTSPNSPLTVSVDKLELHSSPEKIKAYSVDLWKELDSQADSFPNLKYFCVQFKDPECTMSLKEWNTQCAGLAREIAQQMTRMQGSGRLQFDFWDWEHRTYQTVTLRT